jgi:pimeloyl-ACP methyl ester carboxylesterase
MKELTITLIVLIAIYLLASIFLYIYQRKLIYFPTSIDTEFKADEISIANQEVNLRGWVINPGKAKAMIYFGGNSELITHNQSLFENIFSDYSVYLINYRGYGNSEGIPTEAGLFSDSLAIYDQLIEQHQTISAYGRSLGSGPAAYLAANRSLEKLILLTPYDSVAEIAQKLYPIFPVRYLIKDRFDSASVAADIKNSVLLITAENDREIPLPHSLALKDRLVNADLSYHMIVGAAHNDIVDFPQYHAAIRAFLAD